MMSATRQLHHECIKVGWGRAHDSVHHAASLDTGNEMCHAHPETGHHLLRGFLFRTACMLSGLLLGWIRPAWLRLQALAACIVQEDTARRKRLVCCITHAFSMDAASQGWPERASQTLCTLDDEVVVHGVVVFLPLDFSGGAVGACGRWLRRSVPAIIHSPATQSARVCARVFGSLAGNACASPSAMGPRVLRVGIHAWTRPCLVSQRHASPACQGETVSEKSRKHQVSA